MIFLQGEIWYPWVHSERANLIFWGLARNFILLRTGKVIQKQGHYGKFCL
jgi:hypothetical protein